MTLTEQQAAFFKTTKGSKALAYARKWFNDFSDLKLQPAYLQIFYSQEKYNDIVPVNAESELTDYELMFWFWFYKRYERLMNEKQIGIDLIEARKQLAALDAANPLNMVSDFFSSLLTNGKYILIGGFALYVFFKIKK